MQWPEGLTLVPLKIFTLILEFFLGLFSVDNAIVSPLLAPFSRSVAFLSYSIRGYPYAVNNVFRQAVKRDFTAEDDIP